MLLASDGLHEGGFSKTKSVLQKNPTSLNIESLVDLDESRLYLKGI